MKNQLYTLFLLTTFLSFGQSTLLKDINLGNNSSNPSNKVEFNGYVYFVANDGLNGSELWRTDGTELGTTIFKEFLTGEESGMVAVTPFVSNNLLYFFAADGASYFLWKTDGTLAGTEKVKQFVSIQSFHDTINNKLIFTAENFLWASDGTEAGTIKIANYAVFGIDRFVKNGNEIYFSAETNSSIGQELHKTDGTVAGTKLVKDIRPGSSDSFPNQFSVINNTVYFSANNGSLGTELWTTDGTEAGTILVKDINSGSGNSFTYNSVVKILNNELFFIYNNSLWKSDGTEIGTVVVKSDIGIAKTLFILNNKVLVIAYNSSTYEQIIWISDGTDVGTTSFNPNYIEFAHNSEYNLVGNNLYFQGSTGAEGYELWKTDGTENGTFLVKDIHPEFDDNNIEGIVGLNDKAIFTASDSNWLGKELWISDGTENGTTLLKDINKTGNRSSNPQNYFQFNDKTLFTADNGENGKELWVLESGVATMLKDINVGTKYSNPSNFILFNNEVYFSASSKEKGKELWKTDGTEAGTVLVKDINPNEKDGLSSGNFVELNSKMYFFANDGTSGLELWESDGSESGTKIVLNLNGLATNSIYNSNELVVFNNELFFVANDGTNGAELFKSDGTEAGTVLVKDINTSGNSNIKYLNVHPYTNKLYFSAYNGSGTHLWVSEGTANTTFGQQIKNPSNFTFSGSRDIGDRSGPNIIYNTELYFTGESTSNFNKKGVELWAVRYSGTIQLEADINPDSASSYPAYLTDHKGELFFVANDGVNGIELWKANVGGATLVKDLFPGVNKSSNISEIVSFGDVVLFGAGDNYQNKELWKSDGTTEGTVLLQDINPSTVQYGNGSNPSNFFVNNNTLYFSANNGIVGSELFTLQESALSLEKENVKTVVNFSVYPNPTSSILNLKVDNQQIKEVKIFALTGKQVISLSPKNNDVSVSELAAGMYLIQLKTATNTYSRKFIKN